LEVGKRDGEKLGLLVGFAKVRYKSRQYQMC